MYEINNMITIFKSGLNFTNTSLITIQLPEGSEIISLKNQDNTPTIWYMCDTDEPLEDRHFLGLCTGQRVPQDLEGDYIDTVVMYEGNFVLHIFEIYK